MIGPGRRVGQPGAPAAPLFGYGTLRFPEVLRALLGRVPPHRTGSLAAHCAVTLPGVGYPGLVRRPGADVRGLVVCGLDRQEWQLIDEWEDPFYELSAVVVVAPTGALARCLTYRLAEGTAHGGRWSPDQFAHDHLDHFAADTARWRERRVGAAT